MCLCLCACVSRRLCVFSGDVSGSVYVMGQERARQCTCVMHVCSIRERNTGGQGEGQCHKQHPGATVSYALTACPNHKAPLPPRKERPEYTRSQTLKKELEFQENKNEGQGEYTCLVSRLARERRYRTQTKGREKPGQAGSPWGDALGDTE